MNMSPGVSESNLYSVFVIVSRYNRCYFFIIPFVLKKAVKLKTKANGNDLTFVNC